MNEDYLKDTLAQIAHEFRLSPAQLQVMRLLVSGRSTQQITKELFIVPKTLRNHCTRIYAKTRTHNRHELLALVIRYLLTD